MKFVGAISVLALIGCQKENPEFCCTSEETCSDLGVSGTRDCAGGFTCIDDIHTCVAEGCGNGVLDEGEVCDDGNNANDDGCSGNCLEASCFVPATHSTIQAAIDDSSCPTIRVAAGTYAENIMINGNVAITGISPGMVVLDGNAANSVVTILAGTVTLENMTIRNGLAAQGGGVFNRGATTLRGVHVDSNTAMGTVGAGGGIYNDGGSLVLDQTSVTGNHALTNATSADGAAASGAGIFSTSGTVQITGGSVDNNDMRMTGVSGVSARGAGVAMDSGELSISSATVSGNVIDVDGHPTLGTAENARGAGVFAEAGTITLTSSMITGNTIIAKGSRPEARGAGLFAPQVQMTDAVIQNNAIQVFGDDEAGGFGGAIYLAGSAESTIASTTISGNTVEVHDPVAGGPGLRGAAIALEGSGNLAIDGTEITENQGTVFGDEISAEGGGLWWGPDDASTSGTLSISKSTISGNVVQSQVCAGAGVATQLPSGVHELTISQSTISGNQLIGEAAFGAGLHANPRNTSGRVGITVDDSTISANKIMATEGTFSGTAFGAGIGIKGTVGSISVLNLSSSTITTNDASGLVDVAGGVALENTTAVLHDSIISKNTGTASQNADCFLRSAGGQTAGHNLLGSAICKNTGSGTGDLVGVDPKLDGLRDNGGPTATHALLAGSPAIDAGDPTGCTSSKDTQLAEDQRGQPRVNNLRCDIGAFEK